MANETATLEVPKTEMLDPKIKRDWYQTETHVIVSIFVKNLEDVKVAPTETTLIVSAKLPSGNDYSLEIDLAHHILPDQCSHKLFTSKIEIKLKKRDDNRWTVLDGDAHVQNPLTTATVPNAIIQSANQSPKYPSSSKKVRDWEKLENELKKIEEEEAKKPTGDHLRNRDVQYAYSKLSDNEKRALVKSYQESKGTRLLTDWEEVKNKKVEMVLPEGLEFKSWDS